MSDLDAAWDLADAGCPDMRCWLLRPGNFHGLIRCVLLVRQRQEKEMSNPGWERIRHWGNVRKLEPSCIGSRTLPVILLWLHDRASGLLGVAGRFFPRSPCQAVFLAPLPRSTVISDALLERFAQDQAMFKRARQGDHKSPRGVSSAAASPHRPLRLSAYG
jgi:hypothetical protein